MSQSRLTFLFTKYINKEITPEERRELFGWIAAEDKDAELKELLEQMINETGVEMCLPEASSDTILRAIIDKEGYQAPAQSPATEKSLIPLWMSIAAVLVLGFFVSLIFLRSPSEIDDSREQGSTEDYRRTSISTLSGERKDIRLADGTEVWLSPSSTLEYPEVFKATHREVRLSGEAFFEVAPDKNHPFIIYSGGIETKVLGTSFNISAYDSQEEVAVTVVTGKVNVTNTNAAEIEKIELNANQRAVFYKPTTKLVKEEKAITDAPDMLKRKEGMFVYRNEKLQKLINDLEEYFGKTVHVSAQIKDCKVMANFYVTDHLMDILEPIALSINGIVEVNDGEFFISGEGCPK
ncbi:MAG: FecR domain-containing protein [Chitinophagaceae bacterium]|nr:FecR domain-containing protein [Chitinophagaceae bacterium]